MEPGAALAEGREVPRDSSQARGRGQHQGCGPEEGRWAQLVTNPRQLQCICRPARCKACGKGGAGCEGLLKPKLLRDLCVPFPCFCTCGCCGHLWRDMGLALLPTALLVLPALLLWPTLAQDSEEPNVRCGGECWGWGVGCLSSRLLGYTACSYSVGDRPLDRFLSPSLLCLGYSGEAL